MGLFQFHHQEIVKFLRSVRANTSALGMISDGPEGKLLDYLLDADPSVAKNRTQNRIARHLSVVPVDLYRTVRQNLNSDLVALSGQVGISPPIQLYFRAQVKTGGRTRTTYPGGHFACCRIPPGELVSQDLLAESELMAVLEGAYTRLGLNELFDRQTNPSVGARKYLLHNISNGITYKVIYGGELRIGRSCPDNDIDVPVTTGDSDSDLTISRLQARIYYQDRYFHYHCLGHNADLIPKSSQGSAQIAPDKSVRLTDGIDLDIAGKVRINYREYRLRAKDYPPILIACDKKLLSTVSTSTLLDRGSHEEVPICCCLRAQAGGAGYVLARYAVTFGDASCCINVNDSGSSELAAILACVEGKLVLFHNYEEYVEASLNQKYRIGKHEFVIEAV